MQLDGAKQDTCSAAHLKNQCQHVFSLKVFTTRKSGRTMKTKGLVYAAVGQVAWGQSIRLLTGNRS